MIQAIIVVILQGVSNCRLEESQSCLPCIRGKSKKRDSYEEDLIIIMFHTVVSVSVMGQKG